MAKKITAKLTSNAAKNHEAEKKYLYIITRIYMILILAVFPLFVGLEGYDNIVFSKAQFFWIVSTLFLIIFSLFYITYYFGLKIGERPEKFHKTASIADWSILTFILCITISFILSKYKDVAFIGMINRNDGWLTYFLMLAVYFPISRWYRLKESDINIFAVSTLIVCIIGFLQFYGYDFLNLYPYTRDIYSDELGNPLSSGFSIGFRSTIGNRDFLSAYVCMVIIVFAILYIKTKKPIRYLYFLTSVISFLMMIIGASRSARVAVLGAVILFLPYWIEKKDNLGKFFILIATFGIAYSSHHWFMINIIMPAWSDTAPLQDLAMREAYHTLPLSLIFIISIISLIVGIILILSKFTAWPNKKTTIIAYLVLFFVIAVIGIVGIELVGEKMPTTSIPYQARELLHGNINKYTASNRGYVWNAALEVFPNNPLFGTGSDTFLYALGKDKLYFDGERFDKAHNDFLQILVCNGIFALLAYLAILTALLMKSYKSAFGNKYTLMAMGAVIAYLIQSFFGIDTVIVTPIFWVMLAIIRNRQIYSDIII